MNPEFRRLMIVEFQGHRLIAMPTVLAVVFGLGYYLNDYRWDTSTGFMATLGYFALVFIWGTRQAAESVIQEINTKTWPPQRMSSMSAWGLAWAKLAGSTAFTWAGGIVCLAVYGASNAEWWDGPRIATSVALYLGAGVLAQTVCFLASLAAIQRRREFGRVHVVAYQFLGLVFALPPLYIGLSVTGGAGLLDLIIWYDYYLALPQFMLIFMGLFIVWGLAGAWALMRVELQEPLGPWLWLTFVIFTMAFFGGMRSVPIGPDTPVALMDFPSIPTMVLSIGIVMIYVIGLMETKNRFRLRQWDALIHQRQWRSFSRFAPRSLLSLPVVAAATVIAASAFADYTAARAHDLHIVFAAALLFTTRDLGFIYWICLGRTDGRGEAMAAVMLALVYIAVPGVLFQISAHVHPAISYLTAFFAPATELPSWWNIAAPASECLFIGMAIRLRWKSAIAAPVAASASQR